jgi:pyruvate dehydrogenase E1 component beta subunit
MDEPTVVIEHKGLYFTKGEVPEGELVIPFGHAAVRRTGGDVTLVSYSRAVHWCLDAAAELADNGIQAEVIDLRTIVPLDMATIAASVAKTGSAVVVAEGPGKASMAAEIAARIGEECWDDLRAPVSRVTSLDMPVPYSRPLEQAWLPSVADIVGAATKAARGERARATAAVGA